MPRWWLRSGPTGGCRHRHGVSGFGLAGDLGTGSGRDHPDGALDSRQGSLNIEPALNRRSFRPDLVDLLWDVAAMGDLVVEGSERHCLSPFIADYLCQ